MTRNWWIPLFVILVFGGAGVLFMGIRTYQDAPPIPDYVDARGRVVHDSEQILRGQAVFQKYALMNYGSFFGDGASRGTDFTADALHVMATAMTETYRRADPAAAPGAVETRVKAEIKENRHDPATNRVILTEGQIAGTEAVRAHYLRFFTGSGPGTFSPGGYITDPGEIADLSAFFVWGAWVCGARRPGTDYSYTHNWPFDPDAGNTPSGPVTLWTVFGTLGIVFGLGVVLYMYGRNGGAHGLKPEKADALLTADAVSAATPWPTQRATYKFFAVAAVLFLLQVLAGVVTIHDFLGWFFGFDVASTFPITVTRSWHVQLSILWIATCWIAASIFILPKITKREPEGQLRLINALFALLVVIVAGSLLGQLLGPKGVLGSLWRLFGNQGWEFVELGKFWQILLLGSFILWAAIVIRGVRPALGAANLASLPHWLMYATLAIIALFLSSFVAGPRTNFVIADFWRWMVIHMWAEAFFEVFTTVIVAYFMVLMGLVSARSAGRVVYLATILFLGSGILGISHNFYWNAKPVETLALGSIFSTLQVVPLLLLTVEAWRFRNMPRMLLRDLPRNGGREPVFGQSEAFLFLLGVNFWNFMGAGVFGFIINLPIVNYYEHGTYLTVNHGHAALMGVYGNLAVAGMIFCARWVVRPEAWNGTLLRRVFWSLNLGLALMVTLDLFPAGILQFQTVLERGLWFARSHEFVEGAAFQTLTWMRIVGGLLFTFGGVVPLAWFLVTRWNALRAPLERAAKAPAPVVEAIPDLAK